MNKKNDLPNRDIVVFALAEIGGTTQKIHTEEIALKCFELNSASFCWAIHSQYPDKDVVRSALTDAAKEKYGALVEGRTGQGKGQKEQKVVDGWCLTVSGLAWLAENQHRIADLLEAGSIKDHRQLSLQVLKPIRCHETFLRYQQNPDEFSATPGELSTFLVCRPDSKPEIFRGRISRFLKHAEIVAEEEIVDFFRVLSQKYE